METAWLHSLCRQRAESCVPYEEDGDMVLVITIIVVAVCDQIAESTERSLRGHSIALML